MSQEHPVRLVDQHNRTLRFDPGARTIFYGDFRIILNSKGHSELFSLLFSQPSHTATHEQIDEILNLMNIGNIDELPTVRRSRFVSELRKRFNNVPGLQGNPEQVKGFGYCLSGFTEINDKPNQSLAIGEFISKLDQVTKVCMTHVKERTIITRDNGIQYIDFDYNFAIEQFTKINSLLWDIVDYLSSLHRPSDLFDIKSLLYDYVSYVLYWRLGDGLTEQKWKTDYYDEITSKSKRIKGFLMSLHDDT